MQKEAQNIFESIESESLLGILKTNWELFFDTTTSSKAKDNGTSFSELTAILLRTKPEMVAELWAYLIIDLRAINLEKLLKVGIY